MEIILHTGERRSELAAHYHAAFADAVELYIVSAYLTEWDTDIKLAPSCKRFRFIIGKDFGITRKEACRKVMKWLPATRKTNFLVAEAITGFHPKAIIWRTGRGRTFMLVGSSNLSRAAFDGNVEANVVLPISERHFEMARAWIDWIEERSVPVSEDWLGQYIEAKRKPGRGTKGRGLADSNGAAIVTFKLPRPPRMASLLRERRRSLAAYAKRRAGLMRLFQSVLEKKISNGQFFAELPRYWSWELGSRLQGRGWERQGKQADFQDLAASLVSIFRSSKQDRDDVVRFEIDRLNANGNSARKAFLSEMLCLRFPAEYPVLNNPVRTFLAKNRFKAPRGSSEGGSYIDLAKKLRLALLANPKYPAKSLAELDTLIWASSEYNPQK